MNKTKQCLSLNSHLRQFIAYVLLIFLSLGATAHATDYSYSNTTSGSVPDNGSSGTTCGTTMTRTINVSDTFNISDVNVGLVVSHTYKSDLEIRLTSPAGTTANLIIGVGGSSDHFNVLLDSSASSTLGSSSHNTSSAYPQYTRRPGSSLNVFNNEAANGTWTLSLCDTYPADVGTISRFQLDFLESGSFEPTLPTETCEVSAAIWNFNFNNDFAGEPGYALNYAGTGWTYDSNGIPQRNATPLPDAIHTLDPQQKPAELQSVAVSNGTGETLILVSKLEGVPNASSTVTMQDRAGEDHDVFAIVDSLGNLLARYPATASNNQNNRVEDGQEVTLNFTMPADGTAYTKIWIADFGEAYGNHYGDTCRLDHGDADAAYGDPTHYASGRYYLGSNTPDWEDALQADDGADEDGFSLPTFTQGQTVTISTIVTGAGGYLQGWIDFNGNNVFDTSEKIADDIQDGGVNDADGSINGSISLTFTVPTLAITTQTYARFRWSSVTGLDSNSAAKDGEVEDYAITINSLPTGTLEINKTVSPTTATSGSNLVYTLTVTNNYGSTTTGVVLKDLLASDVTYISDDSSGAYNQATGLWTVGSLNNNETKTLNITVKVN